MADRRGASGVGLAAVVCLSFGCGRVIGASEYDEVSRCTGPMCGVCPPNEGWDPEAEICVESSLLCEQTGGRWDDAQDVCFPKGTCPAGERWHARTETCVPSCAEGLAECGPTCCGFGLNCIPDANGNPTCSHCLPTEFICGPGCCELGSECINEGEGVCWSAYGSPERSCEAGSLCGEGESCCASLEVPAGSFMMGASESDELAYADERPEHLATLSKFRLDKYEVTVGRFRRFVDGWRFEKPPPGAGAHPHVTGSGWKSVWDDRLPETLEELEVELLSCGDSTWLAGDDSLPINCVSWFEAFVFCAWDGGRLPTEAEWEYAASGGENRMYPWGEALPAPDLLVFHCAYDGDPEACGLLDIAPVGSRPLGRGKWGHLDLSGNMYEWVLDVFDLYTGEECTDCANALNVPVRVIRGGAWVNDDAEYFRASFRNTATPGYRDLDVGIRCVRAVE